MSSTNYKTIHFPCENNVVLKFPDHPYSEEIESRKYYESLHRSIINFLYQNNFMDKKRNIIDSGAYIGDNSLPWTQIIDGIVYAIDPCDTNCQYIRDVCGINNIQNCKVMKYALSSKEETLSTDGDLKMVNFIENQGKEGKIKVDAVSLDYLYKNSDEYKNIENVEFLHLDIEGFEYFALLGAKTLIEIDRPFIIYEQHYEKEDISLIINFLSEHNYKIYIIQEQAGYFHDCRNFFAIPKEKFSGVLIQSICNRFGENCLYPIV